MKQHRTLSFPLLMSLICLCPIGSCATDEEQLQAVFREKGFHGMALKQRIEDVSKAFLGTPYKRGPMGEGPKGEFERKPLMNIGAVDCTTFVEQVMALALEGNISEAESTLQGIRYKNGVISYETRNHFPEADWIPNNIAAGYIRDITREVAGNKTRTVTRTISKAKWYSEKTEKDLWGFDNLSPEKRTELVIKWRELGNKFPDEKITLDYLPLQDLPEFLNKIPSGAILNVVREPSKDERAPLLVSHQMFLIDTPKGKVVRDAVINKSVMDIPALQYFKVYAGVKWPVLGVNINEVHHP